MNTEDLVKLIKEDKKAIENRDGYTPLFALAENIANGYGDISSTEAEKLILSLDISLFDVDEINTLNGFIYYSKIPTNCISEKYLTYIGKLNVKKRDYVKLFFMRIISLIYNKLIFKVEKQTTIISKEDSLYIKGILMLFIIECDVSKFSSNDILEEEVLHEKFPWIWIDCISHYEWDCAKDDIRNILKTKKNELKNLLYRLPLYKELDKKSVINLSDSLKLWYAVMNEDDKKELKEWTKRFDIPFEERIPFEEKSNRIRIHQQQLLPPVYA
ncbi:MAG: hypothetical protein LBE13_19690 [Bacteroidales bacterium]|jgi:hypothetical protein|nr:hypothetical protein [Bacteroidales bacterium]